MKIPEKKILNFLITVLSILVVYSCNEPNIPKPKGYFRIALPEKKYRVFDSLYPYSFEYPVYAEITTPKKKQKEPYLINIDFKSFSGSVFVTYKKINHNLDTLIEDAHTFVHKHIPKANSINKKVYINNVDKVYGLTFDISGIGAASPYQFYLTDSVHHFFRAALYFNHTPNNDSLAPVINFIKEDLTHLIETFRWKKI